MPQKTSACTHCVQGTQTDFKNELLFKVFGINYSELPAQFRKVCATIVTVRSHNTCMLAYQLIACSLQMPYWTRLYGVLDPAKAQQWFWYAGLRSYQAAGKCDSDEDRIPDCSDA